MRPAVIFLRSFGPALLVLLATAPATAIPFTLEIRSGTQVIGTANEERLGCVDQAGGIEALCNATDLTYYDPNTNEELININSLSFEIDVDPQVNGVMTFTNSQAVPQLFTFIFTLPVAAMSDSLTRGTARGTVTDILGGATVTAGPAGAIFTALIDGNPYGAPQLLFGPYADAAGGGPTTIPSESFGGVVPSFPGGPVSTSIGIQLQLNLSGQDQASITSSHEVVVPEPHTAALLGLGLAVLASRRRR